VPRVYPATIAQCAGISQRADRWCAPDADSVFTYLNLGAQWAPFVTIGGFWSSYLALYLNLHGLGFIGPGLYWDVLWCLIFDPTVPRLWRLTQSRIQAPNTTYDVLEGTVYPYNAAPWTNALSPVHSLVTSNNAAWGDIWDNPI
jgi:hypothetical protein